jgi:hypothetical protein
MSPLNFRCSLKINTPQNVSILCLSYFNTSATQSSSSVSAMHDSCVPSVPIDNMGISCVPSLNLLSSTLSPDSMLLQGGRWPFPGFTDFLFVEFPKVLVPSNFLSLSVPLNRNLRMVNALNPTIGSTFGGYVITFSGVGLNLFGDLKCRVGGMPSLPLKIEFSNVVCPVVPTDMLIKTAELLLSNGTILQSFSFIGSYGLEREASSRVAFFARDFVELVFVATVHAVHFKYNLTATNVVTGVVAFCEEFLFVNSPQMIRINFDSSSFGIGVFEFALNCSIGCLGYRSIMLSAIDLVDRNSAIHGTCTSLAGAYAPIPSTTLPSWHSALYSRSNPGLIFGHPLLAMTPSVNFATVVSSNILMGPAEATRCMLMHSTSRFSLLFDDSAPFITSIGQPFVGLIEGVSFESFRLILDGQMPPFPFNVKLVASSVEHVWEIKSRESYLNASFGEGSALTHYSFVLSNFSMMNWTLYGSNDRLTWLLLDIHKLHDTERSKMFSISQPYPIGGADLQNSGTPSSSIFPWILTHIPGMPAPIPFISTKILLLFISNISDRLLCLFGSILSVVTLGDAFL